jgi:hypothetical protein
LRALGVDREPDVVALLGLGRDPGQGVGQVVGPRCVEVVAATGRVLADGHLVGEQRAVAGRRLALEGDRGVQVALVVDVRPGQGSIGPARSYEGACREWWNSVGK